MDYKELFEQLLRLSEESKLVFKIEVDNTFEHTYVDPISIYIGQRDSINSLRITDLELLKELTEDKFHELVKAQEVKSKIESLKRFELTDDEIADIINR